MTPTTTRPARPRPSASSPAARAPSSSPTRPRTADGDRGDRCRRTSTSTSPWPTSPPTLAGDPAVGEVEKLGPATPDLIRTWLQDSKARILPVLDLNRTDAVDQHDPPPWMREQVILRDRHCVFPWCGRDARTSRPRPHRAYVPMDEGGPPGQTQPPEPRTVVPATSPRQDLHRLDLRTRPRRHLRLDQPPRPHLDRRTRRHPPYDRARNHVGATEPRRTPSPPDQLRRSIGCTRVRRIYRTDHAFPGRPAKQRHPCDAASRRSSNAYAAMDFASVKVPSRIICSTSARVNQAERRSCSSRSRCGARPSGRWPGRRCTAG